MNNTFLKVASILFFVLCVLVALPWMKEMLKGKGSETLSQENVSVNLANFTENSVDRISMKQKDKDEVVLEKSGEEWKVGSDIADKEKVALLFRSFSTLKIREMVSKNESNFKKFGVTKEDGIRCVLREKNGKEHIFYVGNAGMIPQEFFLRKDTIKNAYSVSGNARDFFMKDSAYWKKSEETKTEAKEKTDVQ